MPDLNVGDKAPDFTLPASTGEKVTLSEELGKGPVVLAWYLFDFGRVWTVELSEFRDKADQIRQLGGRLLGISVESDRAHKAFAEHLRLDFPLLSDFNREVVRQYGIQYDEQHPFSGMHGMSKRAAFVIAPDGTVRYKWVTDDPLIAPDVGQVIECLQEIGPPAR
jgi:peroxiredoxin